MKISKSKKELARIISENGGWRDGAKWSIQHGTGRVAFTKFESKPSWEKINGCWGGCIFFSGFTYPKIANYHQAVLSREEYFHLYPAPDYDGWIEWNGGGCPVEEGTLVDVIWRNGTERSGVKALHLGGAGHQFWVADGMTNDIIAYRLHKPEQAKPELCESATRSIPESEPKPTIEQLAADYRNRKDYADRKRQEADAAKTDAEAKLAELVAAGKAIGLVVSVAWLEPELVITDWMDLQVGDNIELTEINGGGVSAGEIGVIMRIDSYSMRVDFPSQEGHLIANPSARWKFIRRP